MMKSAILLVLLGLALAGGYYNERSIPLRAGFNSVNFACGAYTGGNYGVSPQQAYSYTFGTLPNWLTASGNTLRGTPPAGQTGPWYVSVNYNGAGRSGRDDVAFTCPDNAAPTRSGIGFNYNAASGYGAGSGAGAQGVAGGFAYIYTTKTTTVTYAEDNSGYTVLVPIAAPAPAPQAAVSCDAEEAALAQAKAVLNADQATIDRLRNELARAQRKLADTLDRSKSAQDALENCRNRAAAVAPPSIITGAVTPRTETVSSVHYESRGIGGH